MNKKNTWIVLGLAVVVVGAELLVGAGGQQGIELVNGQEFEDASFLDSGEGIIITSPRKGVGTDAYWVDSEGKRLGHWTFLGILANRVDVFERASSGKIDRIVVSGRDDRDDAQYFHQVFRVRNADQQPELELDSRELGIFGNGADLQILKNGTWAVAEFGYDTAEVVFGSLKKGRATTCSLDDSIFTEPFYGGFDMTDQFILIERDAVGHNPAVLAQWGQNLVQVDSDCTVVVILENAGEEATQIAYQNANELIWLEYADSAVGLDIADSGATGARTPSVVLDKATLSPVISDGSSVYGYEFARNGRVYFRESISGEENDNLFELQITAAGLLVKNLGRVSMTAPPTRNGVSFVVTEAEDGSAGGGKKIHLTRLSQEDTSGILIRHKRTAG